MGIVKINYLSETNKTNKAMKNEQLKQKLSLILSANGRALRPQRVKLWEELSEKGLSCGYTSADELLLFFALACVEKGLSEADATKVAILAKLLCLGNLSQGRQLFCEGDEGGKQKAESANLLDALDALDR